MTIQRTPRCFYCETLVPTDKALILPATGKVCCPACYPEVVTAKMALWMKEKTS